MLGDQIGDELGPLFEGELERLGEQRLGAFAHTSTIAHGGALAGMGLGGWMRQPLMVA